LAWERSSHVELSHTEVPLVSSRHRYGGTLDATGVCATAAGRALFDWKTSNSVYGDHLFQLAAYRMLWNENFPDDPITGGFHLCRFSKEFGDFAHLYFPELDRQEKGFLMMRELYDLCKETDKRVK
jgi:hypothetical protein